MSIVSIVDLKATSKLAFLAPGLLQERIIQQLEGDPFAEGFEEAAETGPVAVDRIQHHLPVGGLRGEFGIGEREIQVVEEQVLGDIDVVEPRLYQRTGFRIIAIGREVIGPGSTGPCR